MNGEPSNSSGLRGDSWAPSGRHRAPYGNGRGQTWNAAQRNLWQHQGAPKDLAVSKFGVECDPVRRTVGLPETAGQSLILPVCVGSTRPEVVETLF